MHRGRLALLILGLIPLLVRLSYHAGFEPTFDLINDVVDAFVVIAVGFVSSGLLLFLLGVVTLDMSLDVVMGVIALQVVPASIGAILSHSQLGKTDEDVDRSKPTGYWDELFIMLTGALFIAFNVAPTEEVILVSYKLTEWHGIALIVTSLIVMHAFVYAVEFRGQSDIPEGTPQWSVFLRFTGVGYVIALLMSAYVLWTFGRMDGTGVHERMMMFIVLGLPAAVGAAAARLIL